MNLKESNRLFKNEKNSNRMKKIPKNSKRFNLLKDSNDCKRIKKTLKEPKKS